VAVVYLHRVHNNVAFAEMQYFVSPVMVPVEDSLDDAVEEAVADDDPVSETQKRARRRPGRDTTPFTTRAVAPKLRTPTHQ
jgi:hypothetical protein